MSRAWKSVLTAGLMASLIFSAGCQKKVEVESGTKVLCSYGHTISDNVRMVKVPVGDAINHYIRTEVRTCDKHAQAEKLYREAQEALAKGDLEAAKSKLAEVLKRDSSFANASSQLGDINSGKRPASDNGENAGGNGGSGGSGGSTDGQASTPAGKLTVWTPASLNGFSGAKVVVDVFTATRDYRPTSAGSVAMMVILAEQQRTAAGAESVLTRLVKKPCPYDAASVTVNGRKAYFGTDNRRIATLAFTEGPVMVAIQMAAVKTGSPESMKSSLVEVAKQLP